MVAAAASTLCEDAVSDLYLADPGNTDFPAGYIDCASMPGSCTTDACNCRQGVTTTASDGSRANFVVCVLLDDGEQCTSGIGTNCSAVTTDSSSSSIDTSSGSVLLIPSSSSSGSLDSSTATASDSRSSASTDSTESVVSTSTESSSSTMSTPLMIGIIVVCVVFVALVSWFVRSYCLRRAAEKYKSEDHASYSAQSPTAVDSSPTPSSFPAFSADTRRTRSTNTSASHNSAEGPHTQRTLPRASQQSVAAPMPMLAQDRRQQRAATYAAQHDPYVVRDQRSISQQPNRGTVLHDPRESNHLTWQQQQQQPRTSSRPRPSSQPRISSNPRPSSREQYGAATVGPQRDDASYFAQQAAFGAPTSRPMQPVRLYDPPVDRSSGRSSGSDGRRRSGHQEPPTARLSNKTTNSSAASTATTVVADNRRRPGRPGPPVYQAPPPYDAHATLPLYKASTVGPAAPRMDVSLDSSMVSDSSVGTSQLAWSTASGLSDESSLYQLPPPRVPVMGYIADDVSEYSELSSLDSNMASSVDDSSVGWGAATRHPDDVSELESSAAWGSATQRTEDFANRSTAASSASFFSVDSDFTEDDADYRYGQREREF